MIASLRLLACLVAPTILSGPTQVKPRALTAEDLKPLVWRSVGPANMGGRVSDIKLASEDGKTFFVAYGTGGLFKTVNRGTTFTPVFEHQSTSSIGSVSVVDATSSWHGWKEATANVTDPKKLALFGKGRIVWVGTGEGNGRNSSSWGDGVYRSTDAGATWTHVGLEDSKDIPAICADPRDPDTCYVGALGHLWGPNKMRGIYKTTDGGKSWKPVLQVDESTGAIDLKMDPKDPETLFAAMYHRQRSGYSMESGGPQGGIFRTRDGGKTWVKLSKGLPSQTGRIGLDIYQSNPKILVAVIESDLGGARNIDDARSRHGGVFRSEDGGDSWIRVNAQSPRAFYFSKIRIDPKNDKRVYMLGYDVWKSDDGGRTFQNGLTDKLHPDWHAMAIDPSDSEHLLIGCDGGMFQSFDQGSTWDSMSQVAAGEFYNIAVDDSEPYRIMGGLQDNGSWLGVSSTTSETGGSGPGTLNVGITNGDWRTVGGGDGFHVAFDPTDANVVYTESQGGSLGRYNIVTGEFHSLHPDQKEGTPGYRFNWNTPFFVSPHDPTVLYMGGNCVFKFTGKGDDIQWVSPDLSTKNPDRMITTGSSAETFCTVVALAESTVAKGLLWAGTDDGLIQVSSDDGASWQNVTPNEAHGFYVASVEPSHANKSVAYAAIDGHRNDDYDPHLFMTADLGKSWKDITGDLPKGASARVLREDIRNPEVLYCGTEQAVYESVDRGAKWVKLNGGSLPTVGIHDIVQQPRTGDLVVATHGRSVWVLDDAGPLSALTPDIMAETLHVFPPLAAKPLQRTGIDGLWGDKFFGASNAPSGLHLDYWCKQKQDSGVSVKIENSTGDMVVTLTGAAEPGLNRISWDMQPEAHNRLANRGEEGAVYVPAGTYKATFTMGKETRTASLTVLPYPYNGQLPIPPVHA